ncbi:MAG: nuclear transport factor 2 family protein [Proteobacteria bacterium]|nr:nuclear transport factor 2 family protein [Pseudomonadota bacterium]
MRIQPERSFVAIDERIRQTENPRHRAMLENYRAHLAAEVAGDLDAIMATMSDEPAYHTWSPGGEMNGGPKNRAQTVEFYRSIFDNGYNKLERVTEKLVVNDDYIVNEGWLHTIYPGRTLARMGLDVRPERYYLHSNRVVAILPYVGEGTDVRMDGEDVYTLPGRPTEESIVELNDAEVEGIV